MCRSNSYYPENQYYSHNLLQLILPCLATDKQYCLFLDIDGTLSEFHPDPAQSFIPQTTLKTLQQLSDSNVSVIFLTGRSVEIASKLLFPLDLPIAGTHGLEIKMDEHTQFNISSDEINFSLLQQDIQKRCEPYPQVLIENKSYSVALHYRQCPELAEIAKTIAEEVLDSYPGFKINEGKYVFELVPKQADKGQAIQTILDYLNFNHVLPLFIGDDITDESGFKTINQYQGISIKVGSEPTHAHYRLKNVADVADFLNLFSQFLKTGFLRQSQVSDGEKACLD
ncbi:MULTISPECIES: trehalose-phosphatase [unclassified Acinetobacter]|uniref:trehalose-phosphatase n=1 Tax=unclassified Acinetobacter TaxID=196816 RepID=UPI0025BC406F|nr:MULTISPECIES: trehalose-phosphatase [unclassified Acinetobacter]